MQLALLLIALADQTEADVYLLISSRQTFAVAVAALGREAR